MNTPLLDAVNLTRTVDVGIVALLGLVLNVRYGNRESALLLLGSLVNLVKGHLLSQTLQRLKLCQC